MIPKRDDNDYITLAQARQITGLDTGGLRYHVKRGHIRARRLPTRRGHAIHLHVDDCQIYAYPRLSDLARASNYTVEMLHYLIGQWRMPGLCRFGSQWRINPTWFQRIVRWLRNGRPITPAFTPREPA